MKSSQLLAPIALGALLITPTFAKNNINLSGRLDYTSADRESSATKSQGFEMNSARVGFSGDLNKTMTYKLELEGNVDTTTAQNAISTDTDLVNELNITRKYSDKLTTTFGKQFLLFGGFEFDYNTQDVIQYSLVGGNLDVYGLGLTTSYDVMGQTLSLQIANADRDANGQRNVRYALGWNGKLGMVDTIASYMVNPKSGQDSETFITLGAKVAMNNWFVEADYLTKTTEHAAPTKDDSMTSIVAKAGMTFGDTNVSVKYFMDEQETAGVKGDDRTGYVAAVECAKMDNVKYHVAYSAVTTDYVAATADTTDSKITVGMKFSFDAM